MRWVFIGKRYHMESLGLPQGLVKTGERMLGGWQCYLAGFALGRILCAMVCDDQELKSV